jgi:hypothetical protein
MRVIKSVLKEELDNSLRMQKSYQRELAGLPRGSLVKKNIHGRNYYYLVCREGGKVRFSYKGKIGKEEIKHYREIKTRRAQYRKLLSEVNKQIRFLRGTLRGKKSV